MGKKVANKQRVNSEEGKHIFPAQTLVGSSGKFILSRKLKPLRRSRSDKIREKALEQDYLDKCNALACRLKGHKHLLELILQLTCCNGDGSCNSTLCQELKARHANSITLIKFLLEKLGTTLDVLPKQTQVSLHEMLCMDKKLRAKLEKGFRFSGKLKGYQAAHFKHGAAAAQREDTHSLEEFFQMFVHGIKDDRPLVLMLKQDELGHALWDVVQKKCRSLPSSFILLHQGRKISLGHTLKEQGLTQDCNIHIHFGLCGGVFSGGGIEKDKGSTPRSNRGPQKWKKAEVIHWIEQACECYEIDEGDVSQLKTLSGAGLMKLKRQDWKERSPNQGDFFFNLWTELITTTRQDVSGTTSTYPNSPEREFPGSVRNDNPRRAKRESPRNMSPDGEQPGTSSSSGSTQKSVSGTQGPFGTVENLDKISENHVTVDELSKWTPTDGEVIAVKGLCSSRPRNSGGAGTVLLRNDPIKGGTFLELKVDIRAFPDSTNLTRHIISTILNVKLGEPLFVRGKIERLDKGLTSMKKGFKILPFKIVVDSDQHAAFRKDVKVQRSYLSQLSRPWRTECGIFPAEGSTQEPLFHNEILENTRGILYCPPDAPLDKIKEYAVALKNSLTGDIFVGVGCDGTVMGSRVSGDAIIHKRDDLVKAVGGILPNVDQTVAICTTAAQAHEFVEKEKDFVAAMWLQSKTLCSVEDLEETEEISILFRIHVVKGTSVVNFVRPEHTHAYIRVGTETKLMTDYEDLFSRLESLASRNIPEKTPTCINQEVNKASTYEVSEQQNYHLFKNVSFETDKMEFKVILGDPKKIILDNYVKRYSASFLNSDGGDILFGIEEDRTTKFGFAVGVSMSSNDRMELVHESSKMICNFWPPVDSCQFFMKFIEVKCDVAKNVLKYPKTYVGKEEKFVAIILQNTSNVSKLANFAKKKRIGQIAVLRLKNNRFGLLVKDSSKLNVENFLSEMENESNKSKYFQMDVASFEEVVTAVKDLCVVHLHVRASPYPIHLTSPFLTFCLDQQGMVTEMKPTQLSERLAKGNYQYEPDKLFNVVNGFEKENTSYVLVCSPFCLPRQERDLYGIVVPEWALVLDFDQAPNQEGHLLNIFKPLHDRHQVERNLSVKTPIDRRLELNPRNGVCWCTVRGYEDIDKTLSKDGHALWMSSHGIKMLPLIDKLIVHINPNQLVVVCLWDDGYKELLPSLDFLFQYVCSCWGPTKVVFVCSNSAAKSEVLSALVEPLERAGFAIKRDNIFVALPHELARHVGATLPPPYRSEDAFQIPRKFYRPEGERIIPDTLPQTIRQAIKGHLQIMYRNTGTVFQTKPEDEDEIRVKFYSGSEIDETGLASGIAIEREKMKELKKELKSFLNDKRSHICLTVVKAERGAGATTLCMQLLYEYHKQYVCARLLEFHDSLATNIEKITQHSRLPLILFVDSEMAHLPEFNDFNNEAERRNLNLKLLVVESDLLYSQQMTSLKKKQPIPYFVGTAPFKTVELCRELTLNEVSQLVDQFLKIKNISEGKEHKLKALKERVLRECALRKFAIFSLTVFGRKFTGLKNYVEYRLAQANDLQLQILEFLALIHVYTGFLFPVNALARLANTDVVMLEKIFSNDHVRELLSPPSSNGRNDRRISFVEVAEELLQQQAKTCELSHTLYLKDVALRLAKCALSDPRPSKRIDRITRQLYVTSEYGSEKFSPLVRYMRDNDCDVARDMLHELIETFGKGSMWAHLLAHLAKYYMSVYDDFSNATPLIEEAVREHKEDVLLHHIHGDLIRLHIQNLKDQKEFSLGEVLRYAIRCSSCFEIVKEKRPLMEHGYKSDAVVRKVVMLAAIKSVRGSHFVDFLKALLNERKMSQSSSIFSEEDKYIISLVPDSFANLRAVPINESTAKLKDNLIQNLGTLDELKAFSEDLKEVTKGSNDEDWVDTVVLQTMSLIYSLEIERRQLQPEEADERIQKLEALTMTKRCHDEELMKIWIRCVRLGSKVPNLKAIRLQIDRWLKATGRKSPYALFYNYVVAILEALSDPHDTEKMKIATECVKELLRKRLPRSKGVSQDPSLPVEWLHPKEGRHINSLDSLLYHEDLVREYLKTSALQGQKRAGKEIIEKALFQEKITKWEGVVDEIINDWKGTISFQKRISVSFVPDNVQPSMPNEGDEVQFCLAFNWTGPFAWYVVCPPGLAKAQKAAGARSVNSLPIYSEEADNVETETSEDGDEQELLPLVGRSLHRQIVRPQRKVKAEDVDVDQWGCHLAEEMQGIIVQVLPDKGYGRIHHPNFEERLFFHAKQIVPPVDNLSSIEVYSVVSFTVGKAEKGPRAMNIKTVKEKDIDSVLRECRAKLQKEEKMKDSAASAVSQRTRTVALPKTLDDLHNMRSRQEGHICNIKGPPNHRSVHGFIEVPSTHETLFFQELLSGISRGDIHNISVGTKVQFSVGKGEKGYFAEKMFIQSPESKKASVSYAWKPEGIQEGYVAKLEISRNFGFINILTKDPLSESWRNPYPKKIFFHESELRGYPFNQLVIGDRVHFVVGQNEKGYLAQQIDVQGYGKAPLVVVSQAGFSSSPPLNDPRLFPGSHFLPDQPNIGQFSPMHYSTPRSQPNPLAGRPFQDPGGHPDGDWQSVRSRKR